MERRIQELQNLRKTIRQKQQRRGFQSKTQHRRETSTLEVASSISAQPGEDARIQTAEDLAMLRHDYSEHFTQTGERPQNFITELPRPERWNDLGKFKDLMRLKMEQLRSSLTPPTSLKANLHAFDLRSLDMDFDVILIDPPLKDYFDDHPEHCVGSAPDCIDAPPNAYWTWDQIIHLPIEEISATPSFVFLWVGDGDGLECGRRALQSWGFKRLEDIVWIQTNHQHQDTPMGEDNVLRSCKSHCLMGVKGVASRSVNEHFVHCNIEVDVIVAEQPIHSPMRKPEELYALIENFCQGRRRLELFGTDANVRPGWLTVGWDLTGSNFEKTRFHRYFLDAHGRPDLYVKSTPLIDKLRPKVSLYDTTFENLVHRYFLDAQGRPDLHVRSTPLIDKLRPKVSLYDTTQ